MLFLPNPPACRETQVHVRVAPGATGIAWNARGPVVKDGIVILIVSRGDVVGQTRPCIEDPRHPETEAQWIEESHIESLPAVVIRAAPVAARVVIIGRREKEATRVVKSAGKHILGHDIQFAQLALKGNG